MSGPTNNWISPNKVYFKVDQDKMGRYLVPTIITQKLKIFFFKIYTLFRQILKAKIFPHICLSHKYHQALQQNTNNPQTFHFSTPPFWLYLMWIVAVRTDLSIFSVWGRLIFQSCTAVKTLRMAPTNFLSNESPELDCKIPSHIR